jgi:hypothetical protein
VVEFPWKYPVLFLLVEFLRRDYTLSVDLTWNFSVCLFFVAILSFLRKQREREREILVRLSYQYKYNILPLTKFKFFKRERKEEKE